MKSGVDAPTFERDLVFVGGGHSHALALRMLAMDPLPKTRVTLISDVTNTPYSGMLPGHVAGIYSYDDIHIDLRKLTEFAQVRFILGSVQSFDLQHNKIYCSGRSQPIGFDAASINTGSYPQTSHIEGAEKFGVRVKPVSGFLARWSELLIQHQADAQIKPSIVLVGGGAGGIELALGMHEALGGRCEINLIHGGNRLLDSHAEGVARHISGCMQRRGIKVHLNKRVSRISATEVFLESGESIPSNHTFIVTSASAPAWIRESGFPTDDRGFIQIQETLQVAGYAHIFAVGDTATMMSNPRPKSGVFAVRQAQPLVRNLRAHLTNEGLTPYHPQKQFLSLLNTCDGKAVFSRGPWVLYGRLSWMLKDRIDRKFMEKFSNLPIMEESPENPMLCGGCAAKISNSVLQNALQDSGESTSRLDDAALIDLADDQVSIQSTDYMPALVQDPYLFGKIATQHAMSDVFAMGGQVTSGLLTVILPPNGPKVLGRDLSDLIAGAKEELLGAGGSLIGGHSASGRETALSVTVNGLGVRSRIWPKSGAREGDALILTKPLGVGMLFAAFMRQKVSGVAIDGAIESMLLSNRIVVDCLQGEDGGVHGASDVTGFGLLGHLLEMVHASGHHVQLNMDAIPLLNGVLGVMDYKIESSLAPNNRSFEARLESPVSHRFESILYDPQTSGGLLLSVDSTKAYAMVQTLRSAGLVHATIIGFVAAKANNPLVTVR